MRRKRPTSPPAPLKFKRFKPEEWPEGGPGQWIAEREAWNAAQPVNSMTGVGPLGDVTKLLFDRREARWKWFEWCREIH